MSMAAIVVNRVLVEVGGRSVDRLITNREGVGHDLLTLCSVRNLEHAESEDGIATPLFRVTCSMVNLSRSVVVMMPKGKAGRSESQQ